MKKNIVKIVIACCALMASLVASVAAILLIFKKFFKVSVEFTPKYENEVCNCDECSECCDEDESDGVEFNLCENEAENA